MEDYQGHRRRERTALAIEDLSDEEIEAISRAEPPAEAAQFDHELTVEQGADT